MISWMFDEPARVPPIPLLPCGRSNDPCGVDTNDRIEPRSMGEFKHAFSFGKVWPNVQFYNVLLYLIYGFA